MANKSTAFRVVAYVPVGDAIRTIRGKRHSMEGEMEPETFRKRFMALVNHASEQARAVRAGTHTGGSIGTGITFEDDLGGFVIIPAGLAQQTLFVIERIAGDDALR